jgi:hypothetical protein
MNPGRHIAICLCELCERTGGGAFGPQPDGARPLRLVITARRPRRRLRRRRVIRSWRLV